MADMGNRCDRCDAAARSVFLGERGRYLCGPCLIEEIDLGYVDLDTKSCVDCDTTSEDLYCWDCANSERPNQCDNCGTDWGEVYCEECARDSWFSDEESDAVCSSCGEGDCELFCDECVYCVECVTKIPPDEVRCAACVAKRTSDDVDVVSDDGSTFHLDGMTIRWEN